MAESTGDRLSVLKQVLGRKDKEHVVRGAAAHHILELGLLDALLRAQLEAEATTASQLLTKKSQYCCSPVVM